MALLYYNDLKSGKKIHEKLKILLKITCDSRIRLDFL